MGRVHWVGGEKGGVGKSIVARLLAQYWIDRSVDWRGFDSDRSNGALLRYYEDFTTPVEVSRMADLDQVIDALDDGVREIVVDLAAQTESHLNDWFAAGQVLGLAGELGHEFVFWYVIDEGKDSVRLLGALLDRLGQGPSGRPGPGIRVIAVLNRERGRRFVLFEESKLRNRIEQAGGDVVEIPELDADAMLKIDAYDKSWWAAVHNADRRLGPCLTRMERRRAQVFIRAAYAAFEQALGASEHAAES